MWRNIILAGKLGTDALRKPFFYSVVLKSNNLFYPQNPL